MSLSKEERVEEILRISGFKIRRGQSNIGIGCPLAPYSPLHSSNTDSRPSMGIKVTDTSVLINCFTCGFKSRKLSFLFKRLAYHNSYWVPAVEACLSMESDEIVSGLKSMSYVTPKKVKDVCFDESLFDPFRNNVPRYLINRGVTLDTAKRWGLGFDKEKRRAVFPVRDYGGSLWGCVGRSINGASPKYLNYWNMKKGKHVFGGHLVTNQKKIVIVEGVFDAVLADQAIRQRGLSDRYGIFSVLGASVSTQQVELVLRFATEVLLCFDNDEAGQRGQSEAKKLFSPYVMTRVCSLPRETKDFGDCTEDQVLEVIENAKFC